MTLAPSKQAHRRQQASKEQKRETYAHQDSRSEQGGPIRWVQQPDDKGWGQQDKEYGGPALGPRPAICVMHRGDYITLYTTEQT